MSEETARESVQEKSLTDQPLSGEAEGERSPDGATARPVPSLAEVRAGGRTIRNLRTAGRRIE